MEETRAPIPALDSFSIHEHRAIRVVCVGAGFSGIAAAIRKVFPQKVPNVDFTVYERCAEIGGTWSTNRFPGLACDIPSHCYQYSFEPKTDWSSFYAPGPEILKYLQSVVDKYKLMRYIKLEHEVVHARYDGPSGKWHIRVLRRPGEVAGSASSAREEFTDVADVLITAVGIFSKWNWPEIEGIQNFDGQLIHSASFGCQGQHWEDVVQDWGSKRVGVIGIGSSAIQIVPALQPNVARLVNYVRGKTWICPPFSAAKLLQLLGRSPHCEDFTFTEEDQQRFRDGEFYESFRHSLQADINSLNPVTFLDGDAQKEARRSIESYMRTRLSQKPWIAEKIIPDFGIACRRLTSGPGYLEALCKDNVDFVSSHIKRITSTGVETEDGFCQELDIIICATGYDYSWQFCFPVIGRSATSLQEKWADHPRTYLSLCVDDFPNFFMALGPNSGVSSGSQLAVVERQIDYMVEVTRKLQRDRLKSIEVDSGAVKDFHEYIKCYFPKTVFSQKCRSWYKRGNEQGDIVALWPGSSLHTLHALQFPRWEDFRYELSEGTKNRLNWLGDGQTEDEKNVSGDCAWYLQDSQIDYPPVPE